MVIEFSVSGMPPYKQTPANNDEREHQHERRELLKAEARKICKSLTINEVRLDIIYSRHSGKADPANIIGGIADALQGIVYVNDRQIKTIHYIEKEGDKDQYTISIKVKED